MTILPDLVRIIWMMKKLLAAQAISLILLVTPTALAQSSTSSSTTRKETVKERLDTRKAIVKEKVETRKLNLQERLETRKENIASRTAALKTRLAKFKDQKKADRVEKFNENLNKINENRTNSMLKFIDRMSEILAKVEARVNSVTDKDTSSAKAAIAEAKTKIDTAKAAVEAQAGKDYTITVSTETKVKDDAKVVKESLHSDLQSVKQLVTDAKQAVANAIRVAASTLGGVGNGK